MKHFVEARGDALAALQAPEIKALVEKACLIVDLRGKCRVLTRPRGGVDPGEVVQKLGELMGAAADPFWDNEMWVEGREQTSAERALYEAVWKDARPVPPGQEETFVLDRRFSKDAWLGAPLQPPWPQIEQTPPIASFYSFKGGVGRTTALVALAVNLARAGRRVAVIDFDLEAPGAGSLLLPAEAMRSSLGVVDYLLERPVLPAGALDITEFYRPCDDHRIIGDGEPIFVVPSGVVDAWYIEKLARLNYEYLYRSATEDNAPQSPLHDLFRSLRNSVQPEVLLVDSRAGFHDLGGLSLSGIAHLQVLFGLSSSQSWEGLSLAVSHLGKDMVLSGGQQRACMMVHAMVSPRGKPREEEIRAFKERSFQVFSDNYYDAPDIAEAEWPVPDPESTDSPHFPFVLTRDDKISGYTSPADVAEFLCEGEYRGLANAILARVGRGL